MTNVHWYDWSEEAFRKAQAEDKPVVLAITAPWCQGCREMDDTTYRDPDVVELLNRDYVPVRVDSDRRPDINARYNLGGWPTTAFLTPSCGLLGGTTYLDPKQMKQMLVQLKVGYATHKARIEEEIARRDQKIALVKQKPFEPIARLTVEVFRKTVRGIVGTFDAAHAGFGKAPKFPLVSSLRVVLHALHETGGNDFRTVLTRTLDAMGDRGMYDQVEGGFFHYATNDLWTAPRFEKIGEDNAGLIRLYADAALVTGEDKYRAKALHAIDWALATLYDDARGVFYGSQAADEQYYLVPAGDRKKRPAPAVDRTVYTPASAAMGAALVRAAEVLEVPLFAEAGLRAVDFLLGECAAEQGVAYYHDGGPRVFNLARAPIALASAALDAFDHTGERRYVEAAGRLMGGLTERFWSEAETGIVDRREAPGDRGDLGVPRKVFEENAAAAENFARLWRHGGRDEDRARAERILTSYPDFLDEYGHATADYALACDWLLRPPTRIRIGAKDLAEAALRPYVPRRVAVRDAGGRVVVERGESIRTAATAEEIRQILQENA